MLVPLSKGSSQPYAHVWSKCNLNVSDTFLVLKNVFVLEFDAMTKNDETNVLHDNGINKAREGIKKVKF